MGSAPHEQDLATEKRKLLAEMRSDLLKRQLSNSENYDKAVLSLSTAFLGFSLAFLKDLVPVQRAEWLCLLYGSWTVLAGAVLATIVSFWVSQRGIDVQLKKAEDYYLRDDQTALTRSGIARITEWVNAASGVLFVLGVSLTTVFVIVNFERGVKLGNEGKANQVPTRDGATIPRMQEVPFREAASIPNLQPVPQNSTAKEVPLQKGAPIPNLQPVPPNQQPQSQPPAQSNPATPPGSGTPASGNKK